MNELVQEVALPTDASLKRLADASTDKAKQAQEGKQGEVKSPSTDSAPERTQ